MNSFQQAAALASAPIRPPVNWQRFVECEICGGQTLMIASTKGITRKRCNHRQLPRSSNKRLSGDGNVSCFTMAAVDQVKMQFPLATAPVVKAGFPSPAADYLEDRIDLNELMVKNPAATFFVRVSGDSMKDAGIFEDDVVSVDRSLVVAERKVVVAVFEGTFFIKRLRYIGGRPALCSENQERLSEYPPMFLTDDPDHIIWGVVTGSVRQF